MKRVHHTPPQSPDIDEDGLPFPSDKDLAQLQADGLANPPALDDWADFTSMLRHAAAIGRSGKSNPQLPPGMTEIEMSLRTVVGFLQKQPLLMGEAAVGPLLRLHGAISDLAIGKISPLFKPAKRPANNPGKGGGDSMIMGMAAKTMSMLMESGSSEVTAAQKVAAALRANGGDYSGIRGSTVKGWRDRIRVGPGGKAPDMAIQHYQTALPDGMTATWLLDALRKLRDRGIGNMNNPSS